MLKNIMLPWSSWEFIILNSLVILIFVSLITLVFLVLREVSMRAFDAQSENVKDDSAAAIEIRHRQALEPKTMYAPVSSSVPKGTFSDFVELELVPWQPVSDDALAERRRIVSFLRNQIHNGGWWQQVPAVVLKTMADAIEKGIVQSVDDR